MYDVVVFGSALVDIFVYTDFPEVKNKISYPVGAKMIVKDMCFLTGGGGTNCAVSLSRLGLKAAYLGKLGRDESSAKILKELKKEKVKFLGKTQKGIIGHSIILDSKEHNRTILTYKGLSDELCFDDVNLERLKNSRWFYFSSLSGQSFKTQCRLADFAFREGIKLAYNPSSYLTAKGARFLKPILSKTTLLVLNRDEAKMLVPQGHLLRGLHALGPKIVCVTSGPDGAMLYDGKQTFYLTPHRIKVVERTGAGDSFASGFLAALIRGRNPELALQIALANSESVISFPGAKNKLLSWSTALSRAKKNPAKVEVI